MMASSSCSSVLELLGGQALMGVGNDRGGPTRCPFLGYGRRFREPPRSLRLKPRAVEAVLMADPATAFGNTTTCPSLRLDPYPNGGQAASSYRLLNNKKEREDEEEEEGRGREPVTPEKLDQWLRESIGEIVGNIGGAPFLVYIFSSSRGGPRRPSMVRLEREAVSPESWSRVKKRWDHPSCTPDGVILVEELKDEEQEDGDSGGRKEKGSCGHCARTWGLVVQGRGMDCAACYILNTCRVRSSVGFCTHFCLVRAKCFGEPTEMQLRKAWLQGR